ncbi:unnamed protein product [Symbiodinium sp. KB8]|nr:unnamed protein product [Symbiodinium sp. KB8]
MLRLNQHTQLAAPLDYAQLPDAIRGPRGVFFEGFFIFGVHCLFENSRLETPSELSRGALNPPVGAMRLLALALFEEKDRCPAGCEGSKLLAKPNGIDVIGGASVQTMRALVRYHESVPLLAGASDLRPPTPTAGVAGSHANAAVEQVELEEVPDNLCLGGPAQSAEELRLDQPSKADPFVFLWDEKCNLSFKQNEMNVIGTPFFLKTYSPEILSANVDWNIFPVLGCRAPVRQPRCFILLRNPIDRFISYYLERSDRLLEGGSSILRFLSQVPLQEFEAYLDSIRFDRLRFSGEESGLFCNRENGELCLARDGDVFADPGPESSGFRSHGGPQNRLARMLDPPYGRLEVAKARLSRCVVSLQNEDFENHLLILRAFYPWLKRVKFPESDGTAQNIYNTQESAFIRDNLPAQYREAIARYNSVDMELYQFGVERFYWQVAEDDAAGTSQLCPDASFMGAMVFWGVRGIRPSEQKLGEVLPLRSRDWEANWPFFQEQLPTAFLMRCGRLVGERTPEGVDYKLPPALAEQLARLASDAYYSQSPERFYTLGFRDLLREVGQVKAAEYQDTKSAAPKAPRIQVAPTLGSKV